MDNLLYKQEVFAIVEFLEPVYQAALEVELNLRDIPFESQKRLQIFYKGIYLNKDYIPDFVCFEKIIVEIKALNCLTNTEISQILNYLKATGLKLGLLINFGSKGKLEWKRLIL